MASGSLGHNGGPPISPDSGWIAIARTMRNHPIVGFHIHATPADPRHGAMQPALAWIDMLFECRYTPGTVNNNGKLMKIERGQLVGATSWLAARWNWTPKAVRVWLSKLENHGMISFAGPQNAETNPSPSENLDESQSGKSSGRSKGRFANVITICKYSKYQLSKEQLGQVDGHDEGQAEGRLRAGSGQVEGRLPYIENARALTKKQDNKETREHEGRPETAPPVDGAALAGHQVHRDEFAEDAITSVASWMHNGDRVTARNWLQSTCNAYGRDVVKAAYVKLITDMNTGRTTMNPLQTMSKIAERIAAERKAKPPDTGQPKRLDLSTLNIVDTFAGEPR